MPPVTFRIVLLSTVASCSSSRKPFKPPLFIAIVVSQNDCVVHLQIYYISASFLIIARWTDYLHVNNGSSIVDSGDASNEHSHACIANGAKRDATNVRDVSMSSLETRKRQNREGRIALDTSGIRSSYFRAIVSRIVKQRVETNSALAFTDE